MQTSSDAAAAPSESAQRRPGPALAHGGAPACRLCRRPLTALQRIRGDLCDAMDCRRKATDERLQSQRDAVIDTALDRAAVQWDMPRLRETPLVWLADHERQLAPVTPDELAEQRAYLLDLGCASEGPDPLDDTEPDDAGAPPQAGHRLCALCSGRCCRTGRQQHAYLRSAQLRRWLACHEGTAWVDAVDHYMRLVAESHLAGSCLHHGEYGCTLPREMRSDICNDFACAPLERVQALASADPAVVVVAGVVRWHGVGEVALVSAKELRLLPVDTHGLDDDGRPRSM
jgi:hypothetical protein